MSTEECTRVEYLSIYDHTWFGILPLYLFILTRRPVLELEFDNAPLTGQWPYVQVKKKTSDQLDHDAKRTMDLKIIKYL